MNYSLEKKYNGRNKFQCPKCGVQKKFTRYMHIKTNEYLSDVVGICDRINSCGYHYPPKQYFEDNKLYAIPSIVKPIRKVILPVELKPIEYLEIDLVEKSLNENYSNNFKSFLRANFNEEDVVIAISKYKICTTKYYPGGTVFWQLDEKNQCRYGKVFSYDKNTGKRDKTKVIKPVHSILGRHDFNHSQCLFGLHLLKDFTGQAVNVVEAEKTAVIASIELPDELWLACGGIQTNSFQNRIIIN